MKVKVTPMVMTSVTALTTFGKEFLYYTIYTKPNFAGRPGLVALTLPGRARRVEPGTKSDTDQEREQSRESAAAAARRERPNPL